MPENQTDVNTEASSSNASTPDVNQQSSQSSSEQTQETQSAPTIDEALQKVLDDANSQLAEKPESEVKVEAEKTEKVEEAKTEDEKGPIPYERFAEVNTAKVQLEEQIEQVKPLLEAQKSINEFLGAHGVSQEEFHQWMQVMALSKSDPLKAMQVLQPKLQEWQTLSGDVLPSDIQRLVDDGKMDLEVAKRLAAAEGKTKLTQESAQRIQQQQIAQQQARFAQEMSSAIDGWHANKAKTNPDFVPSKDPNGPPGVYEVFIDRLHRVLTQVPPKNPQDLVASADKVFASIQPLFQKMAPKLANRTNVRSSQTTTATASQPKNYDEAMRLQMQKHGLVTNGK